MKKIISLLILAIAVSLPMSGRDNALSRLFGGKSTSKTAASTTKTSQRENDIFESVRLPYSQGKISADSVVSLALYHKVWSPLVAERCLQLAADNGNARAMAELGLLYTHYTTAYLFPGKAVEGVKLLEKAANAGIADAYDYLGIYYQLNNDFKKARQCFEAGGHKNNAMALCIIGGMIEDGTGYKKDAKKACEYYGKSAMEGYANGASKYGYSLQRPWFAEVSLPDAFFWFYIAGDLGNDAARSNLWLPLRGERFGDDIHTMLAQKSLQLVEDGHKGQSFSNEPLYKDGFLKGIKEREKRAEEGDDWSRFYLGSMNYNDDFLNQNYARAASYYEQVAKNGKLPAPLMAVVYERLGEMYRDGKGVKANKAKATEYTRKAAKLGSLTAYKIVENISD